MSQKYSTDETQITIPIVNYEDIKDLPNHPEKILIDVREPNELQETGQIPTSINIPCKIFFHITRDFIRFRQKRKKSY